MLTSCFGDAAAYNSTCTGDENLEHDGLGKAYLGWTGEDLEKTYNVYLAVYVIAQALEEITKCEDGKGLLKVRLSLVRTTSKKLVIIGMV